MQRILATHSLPRLNCSTSWLQRANGAKRQDKDSTSTSNLVLQRCQCCGDNHYETSQKISHPTRTDKILKQEIEKVPAPSTFKVDCVCQSIFLWMSLNFIFMFMCEEIKSDHRFLKHLVSVFVVGVKDVECISTGTSSTIAQINICDRTMSVKSFIGVL